MQWLRLYHDTITDPKWRVVANDSGQPEANVLAVWMHMMINASGASERGTLEGWNDRVVAAGLGIAADAVTAIRAAMQGLVLDGDRLTGWDKRQRQASDDAAARKAKSRAKQQGTTPPDDGNHGHGTNGQYRGGNAPVTGQSRDNGNMSRDNTAMSRDAHVTASARADTDLDLQNVEDKYLHTPTEPIAPLRGAGEKVAFVGSTFKFSGKALAELAKSYPAIPDLTKTLGAYDLALAGKANAYGELHVKLLHENNYHSTHAARRSAPPKPNHPPSQDRTGVPNALHARRARHG